MLAPTDQIQLGLAARVWGRLHRLLPRASARVLGGQYCRQEPSSQLLVPSNHLLLRLLKLLAYLGALVVLGTCGYVLIEGWSLLEGFYMTVITLSTVGYTEVRELSPLGRSFTSLLIFTCLLTMTIWTAALTSFVVEGDLGGRFLQRRMLRMIAKLKGHTIVCGAGLMGQAVIERLMKRNEPVVAIDKDGQLLAALRRRWPRLLTICGSGTDELTLAQANVLEARYVVAAMGSDVDNLLLAITCRDMGDDIHIFARSNDASIANRMRKAGVDEVISPSQIGGSRVAELILA